MTTLKSQIRKVKNRFFKKSNVIPTSGPINDLENDGPQYPFPSAASGPENPIEEDEDVAKVVLLIMLIPLAVVAFFGSFKTVPAGHMGVVKRFGEVRDELMPPGLNLKWPFIDWVWNVDTRIRSIKYYGEASSLDLQIIKAEIDLQYSLSKPLAGEMIINIGLRDDMEHDIIYKGMAESLKAATANFTSEELITSRPIVKEKIQNYLTNFIDETLSSANDENTDITSLIQIANLALVNFEFSAQFNEAIESKVKAVQEALKAVQEKTRRITLAEAYKEQVQINADAQAYGISTVANAKAQGITEEGEALKNNTELLTLRSIEAWNGRQPEYLSGGDGGAVIPVINTGR